jgi:BASS family bile acid:Na+ symporter
MRFFMKIIEKTWLIFLLSMLLALIFPQLSKYLEKYLIYFLIAMITVPLTQINLSDVFNKRTLKKAIILFLINSVFLSAIIIILALVFIKNSLYFAGFVVMAAVPCAIAVIPFTRLLKGDVPLSTSGFVVGYLFSLIITPAIIWLFFRQAINLYELLEKIFQLVILPIFFSRIIRFIKIDFSNNETKLTNIFFFFTTFGFVGINRETLVNEIFSLKEVMLVLFLRTFVLVFIIYFLLQKLKVEKKYAISLTVFTGYKNLGYAALLSLTFFGREAALPATFGIIFEIIMFIILDRFNGVHISK